MKRNFTSCCLLFALPIFLSVSFSIASRRAYAGYWTISFQCSGQTVERPKIPLSSGGVLQYVETCPIAQYWYAGGPITTPWPTTVAANSTNSVYFGKILNHVWTTNTAGSITPVLTWTKIGPTDLTTPPPSVTIQETAYSDAYSDIGENSGPLTASDGLGDPGIVVLSGAAPGCSLRNEAVTSSGSRIVTVDTGGQPVVTFAPMALSAVGGAVNDNGEESEIISLAVSILTPVQATSTAGTIDPTNPAWFSGTACTATGTADLNLLYGASGIPSGDYITNATISVGGTVVKRYPEDYTNIVTMTHLTAIPNLAAMWDSTHFADGTLITVEVEVHDAKGKGYKAHLTAPAYNEALILENHTVDYFGQTSYQNTWQHITNVVGQINHTVTPSRFYGKDPIVAVLPTNTVFYMATHGTATQFEDCNTGPAGSSDGLSDELTPSDLAPAIASKTKGATAPLPPYNFVELDACDAGTVDIATPFLDGVTDGFPISSRMDRAFLGFTDPLQIIGHNGDWTERVWDYLSQGETLSKAVKLSTINGVPWGGILIDNVPIIGSFPKFFTEIAPTIRGDGAMTLHGVFGGKPSWQFGPNGFEEDLPWYRPL